MKRYTPQRIKNIRRIGYIIIAIIGVVLPLIILLFSTSGNPFDEPLGFLKSYLGLLAIVFFVLLIATIGVSFFFMHIVERRYEEYVKGLAADIDNTSFEFINEMNIGVLAYDELKKISWTNNQLNDLLGEVIVDRTLSEVFPHVNLQQSEDNNDGWLTFEQVPVGTKVFKVLHNVQKHIIYLINVTEEYELRTHYENEKTVIGYIFIDNYDTLSSMEDRLGIDIYSHIQRAISVWGQQFNIYLRRYSSYRWIIVGDQETLATILDDKMSILDRVREIGKEFAAQTTVSIGFGNGDARYVDLSRQALEALELAQSRGGDQAVVKDEKNNVQFIGGKTNTIERRSRARARAMANTLHAFIEQAEHVLIMGHRYGDLDSLGASMGVLEIVEAHKKKAKIVIDFETWSEDTVQQCKELLSDHSDIFIAPVDLDFRNYNNDNTLVIVVDVNTPALVEFDRILSYPTIVIDHHRRGAETIEKTLVTYIEPYASSAGELVTELISYQPMHINLRNSTATLLFAGIVLDTQNFIVRTSARTFDAASLLRTYGADGVWVQNIFKEQFDSFFEKYRIIEQAIIFHNHIAIAPCREKDNYTRQFLAEVADRMLSFQGVQMAFAVGELDDGTVGVSARSIGSDNVQIIMEKLGGGGHFNNAAAQIKDTNIDEVIKQIKTIIEE
ncbi:DHH family phosphoesterase [Culicoidibacter larvae]|uniref:Cyclic-di-AMP phosphodiesterase n=1 Tax=Culicoidibacter larvae TaxID=2579976 RepID=A0A5R8QHD8_9FIRM|nr:DHH family phosphoesterase [Culicoidibacter larvae]TLG77455.1 hypothetical protein FEZ08_02205 [Culicoidibacter larvae]